MWVIADIIFTIALGIIAWHVLVRVPGRWYRKRRVKRYEENPDPLFQDPD